jgi:hypothetical protein
LTKLVCLLCLVVAIAAACGGGDDGDEPGLFSQSFVEGAMTDILRNPPETDWRLDSPVECDDTGDGISWTCTAEAVVVAEGADKGKRLTLTVETTCGVDSVGKRICTRVSTTESEPVDT